MADLYHLLDEEILQEEPIAVDESQDWEQEDREHIELPDFAPTTRNRDDEDDTSAAPLNLEDLDTTGIEKSDISDSSDYGRLRHQWTQELRSPELMFYEEEATEMLIKSVEEMENQEEMNNNISTGNHNIDSLVSSVQRLDTERVKHMLSHYLKTRLMKIQKHPLHMRDFVERMSDSEVDFLKGYGQLMEHHLRSNVTDHFPQEMWKKLDEESMIDRPDVDTTYVFAEVLEDCVIGAGEEVASVKGKGDRIIVQYNLVRSLIEEEKVKLLL